MKQEQNYVETTYEERQEVFTEDDWEDSVGPGARLPHAAIEPLISPSGVLIANRRNKRMNSRLDKMTRATWVERKVVRRSDILHQASSCEVDYMDVT